MDKIRESLLLRGVCSAIQNMHTPLMNNLKDLLAKVGINIEVKQS